MNSNYKQYFLWRMVSAIGDEVWAVSIPVILAGALPVSSIGQVYSFGAIGTLLGFFLATWVASKFNEMIGSFYCDVLQSFIFLLVAIPMIFKIQIPILAWLGIFFIIGFLSAVWFSLSESMISYLNKVGDQSLHKWNYLAGTSGPILGPVIGGILISIGGFFSLPLFNAISFFGQARQINLISKNNKNLPKANSGDWLNRLKEGIRLIVADAGMRGLTAIPIIVKISLVGLLPFISVKIIQTGYSAWIATSIISCFSVGSLVGGLSFGHPKLKQVNFSFQTNVYAMLVVIVSLIFLYTLSSTQIAIFALALFIAGFFSSQYTIQLRNMRQKIVPAHLLSSVISGQSLLVRLATPISGYLFGQFVFKQVGLSILLYITLILVAVYGVSSVKSKRADSKIDIVEL
ncbi:MAG: hypothetical protein ACXVCP_16300 [Bdellovibrio sp.]